MNFLKKIVPVLFICLIVSLSNNSNTVSAANAKSHSTAVKKKKTTVKKTATIKKRTTTKKTSASTNKTTSAPANKSAEKTKPIAGNDTIAKNAVNQQMQSNQDMQNLAANPKEDYFHAVTQTSFPYHIGNFERKQVVFYKNTPSKIDVIYELVTGDQKSSFTIGLTPFNEGQEGRLRNFYLAEARKFAKEEKKENIPMVTPVKFKGFKYICNGIKGTYAGSATDFSRLIVYECGTWLLQFKLKSNEMDSTQFEVFDQTLTERFEPSRLTALQPLKLKSNVDFERDALNDTVIMAALVGSAFKKMDWAKVYISENERASGFPDMYLDMHIAAWKEYLQVQARKTNLENSIFAKEYYDDLTAVDKAGFLPEFIMEQYDNIMIVPGSFSLDFDGYHRWKKDKNLTVDLNRKMYNICYRKM